LQVILEVLPYILLTPKFPALSISECIIQVYVFFLTSVGTKDTNDGF